MTQCCGLDGMLDLGESIGDNNILRLCIEPR
jgi:hypothetical protein